MEGERHITRRRVQLSCASSQGERAATESSGVERSLFSAIYLALSFVSGLTELGGVVFAIRKGYPIAGVLVFGMAYQLGALFKNPLHFTRRVHRLMAVLGVLGSVYAVWHVMWVPLAIFLVSAGLQGAREDVATRCSVGTLPKRVARILGFAAVGLFTPVTLVVMGLLISALGVAARTGHDKSEPESPLVKRWEIGFLGLLMVLHQMHYFAYCYVLPYVFVRVHGLGAAGAGLAFAIGWVSYSLAPTFLRAVRNTLLVLVVGHLAVGTALLLMIAASGHLPLLLAIWFASGFGGGTVFGIRRLNGVWPIGSKRVDLDLWENVGHLAGVLSALALSVFVSGFVGYFLLASVSATIVATALLWKRRISGSSGALAEEAPAASGV